MLFKKMFDSLNKEKLNNYQIKENYDISIDDIKLPNITTNIKQHKIQQLKKDNMMLKEIMKKRVQAINSTASP